MYSCKSLIVSLNQKFEQIDLTEEEQKFIEDALDAEKKGTLSATTKRSTILGLTWRQLSQHLKNKVISIETKEEIISLPYHLTTIDVSSATESFDVQIQIS